MITISFGDFPVDMTDENFFDDKLPGGNVTLLDFSSTSLVGIFPDGSTLTITGHFDFSSVDNFLQKSFVSGFILDDQFDDLVFSLTGLPRITFSEADNLSGDDIAALIRQQKVTINGSSSFSDILVGGPIGTILNGLGGDDQLMAYGGNDKLNGGEGDDVLEAGSGDDLLNGGPGADYLDGGNGSDTTDYSGSVSGVVINLVSGIVSGGDAGGDTLIDIENVRGSGFDDELVAGNASRLTGGGGNDTYWLDNINDQVIELAGGGTDTVISSAAIYVLPANVENLSLSNEITGVVTGNALSNVLSGNRYGNTLNGAGGHDTLYGFAGNDQLIGGVGNDNLDGGFGADLLNGGAGNDIYYIDRMEEVQTLVEGGGVDSILSRVSVDLRSGAGASQIENVTLAGAYARNIYGNNLNNVLTGNARNNTLDGGSGNDTLIGGGGSDVLTGGAGADVFVFDAVPGVDQITDYVAGGDDLRLDKSVFGALSVGLLAGGSFVVGTSAVGADDYIIYNNVTGALFYDSDGNGGAGQIQFALLTGAPALTAADITVVA